MSSHHMGIRRSLVECFWLWISQEGAVKMLTGVTVIWRLDRGWMVSSWHVMLAVGERECSVPHQRAAWVPQDVMIGFPQGEWTNGEREGSRDAQAWKPHIGVSETCWLRRPAPLIVGETARGREYQEATLEAGFHPSPLSLELTSSRATFTKTISNLSCISCLDFWSELLPPWHLSMNVKSTS